MMPHFVMNNDNLRLVAGLEDRIVSGYLARPRDYNGISELPQIKLNLPYKISCIWGSSEIPLLSLSGLRMI